MKFDWLDKIIELLIKDKSNGITLIIILVLIFLIVSLITVYTYKNNSFLQRVVNKLPFIKKEYIIMANFSKKIGCISNIVDKYTLSGYKIFKLLAYKKDFNKDGTISKENLEKVISKQQKKIRKAKSLMKNKSSFIYIGFPHLPLGFLDGYCFNDIDSPILYEYQGIKSETKEIGFYELSRIYNTSLEIFNNVKEPIEKEIVLKIEQSFKISDSDINKNVNVSSVYTFGPSDIKRCGITNYAQIDVYKNEFEKLLDSLKSMGVVKIHLFATTPASLSFSLGRVIKHYHPEVIVYNYNNGIFDWAINLRNQQVFIPNLDSDK